MKEIDYSIQYKKWHSNSIEHYEKSARYYERILSSSLPKDKSAKILDIGCGFGLALYAIKKMGYENVKGIDISLQQVEVAKKYNLNVEHTHDSKIWLNENKDCYDVIILLDVLEHIPVDDQRNFLFSISENLKPSGSLLCSVPNANSSFATRWLFIDWTHQTSFSEHSLEFVLLNSGFNSVKMKEIEFITRPRYAWLPRKAVLHWWAFSFFRFIRRVEAIAELGNEGRSIPLSLNIFCVAKK